MAVRYGPAHGQLQKKSLDVTTPDLESFLDQLQVLDHQLLCYVESGVAVTKNQWHLAFCLDKGNAAGLQLQPAAIFVGNLAIAACPMVRAYKTRPYKTVAKLGGGYREKTLEN